MAGTDGLLPTADRLLVKLRPSAALGAAGARVNLRPLYDSPEAEAVLLGIGAEPEWFVAELADPGQVPWDGAHARVADQLGIAESDVLFAEPDLTHDVFVDDGDVGLDHECAGVTPQDGKGGKAKGPAGPFGWHLDDEYSQLATAREAVAFSEPRTRIAHLDTGYFPDHVSKPARLQQDLEHNFAERDGDQGSAADPANRLRILDASGHGTGTLGILAGRGLPGGRDLGGSPDAEIVPIRIAGRVVLLRTSAFARGLRYAIDTRCDVVSMSMGGLPSRAWREMVDRAYLRGVCIVSAAGNNFGGAPTRNIVYPARYGRVIAACGVMADGSPYSRLQGRTMEGNHGPRSKMKTAIAAYTPNIPWAVFGCDEKFRMNGAGTSSATPQIAAAAALWFEKYKAVLPRDWRRVEAVRHALFSSARGTADPGRLGHGILQAAKALAVRPVLDRQQTKSDRDSFAFLRVLTGLGLAEPSSREEMFNLELAQRWLRNPDLQEIVKDPDATDRLGQRQLHRLMEAVIEDLGASRALRRHVAARWPVIRRQPVPSTDRSRDVVPENAPVCETHPAPPDPPHRRLRVYAVDPSLSGRLATVRVNEVTLHVRWEKLGKGPIGEYLAVRDVDASGKRHEAVDLDAPTLLAQDGWKPAEGNPQFHQQMVYAVGMSTIEHFERALGRPVLWRPNPQSKRPADDFVGQLTVRPHALRQANAYYSPRGVELQFGYFEAPADDPGETMPGSRVYACLSHDIVAHETTHAVLDGMYRRFNEPTNPDVLAFHEAFADIVALMQHFAIPEILESEIARTRGDIEAESVLGRLAVQFGRTTGRQGALREAIGTMVDGRWTRLTPDPTELHRQLAPHARGAILVAAVFDAFIAIYRARTADLYRIYTGGTGVLPDGAIHPDLVGRLADEAARSAQHVLGMCIRALDYLPPVDVTFFEYLRALITADHDLVPDDRYNYRVAFVEAFRRRGIYPIDLHTPSRDTIRTLSVDTLRWQGIEQSMLTDEAPAEIEQQYMEVIDGLKRYADACLYLKDRRQIFEVTRDERDKLRKHLEAIFKGAPNFARELGLDPDRPFEVDELRRAMRVGPDGMHAPQVIVMLTQSIVLEGGGGGDSRHTFRGGSTLVVDLSVPEVRYRIVKRITSERRQERTVAFLRGIAADPLRALFLAGDGGEPFAALHALAEDGD
jgi:subtilisin family serine protease